MRKILLILLCILSLHAQKPSSGNYMLFVGNYTQDDSQGIDVYRFNGQSGKLTLVNTIPGVKNPSYITLSPDGGFLYAVEELTHPTDKEAGRISAFKITDLKRGEAQKLNTVSSAGEAPCYITFDTRGENLLVANYLGGRVGMWPLKSDGRVSGSPLLFQAPAEKSASHMHSIRPLGGSGLLLAADLGRDALYVLSPDKAQRELKATALLKVPAGSGPRHFDFYDDGAFLYAGNEKGNTVSFFRRVGPAPAQYRYEGDFSTLPDGFGEKSWVGDIHVHPRLPYLYVSNRGHNSLARFKIEKDGRLRLEGVTDVGGDYPRNFLLDREGNFLLVAHQKSFSISLFRLDARDGSPHIVKTIMTAASPVCLQLVPINN